MKTSLILACAGKGTRTGFEQNKLLINQNGKTILEHTLSAFIESKLIDQIIIATSKDDYESIKQIVPNDIILILGGETRTQSIKNALDYVNGDIVLIHDGARPFVSTNMIKDCIDTTKKFGSAIPIVQSRDTVAKIDSQFITEYIGKESLGNVQTPQGFTTALIKEAYENVGDRTFNDDGEIYLNYTGKLAYYNGETKNVKLTFKEDFCLEQLPQYRFGTGFDCHKLVKDRKLILGGVNIPHDKGLLGHSDADVLLHAIMDAILSALSLRDIGYHFSDKDPTYKDANSMHLLEKVLEMIKEKGYKVQSISATIMAEKPKLLSFIPDITNNLAQALNLTPNMIGIGATTLEGLGFVGREEGICSHATATLEKI